MGLLLLILGCGGSSESLPTPPIENDGEDSASTSSDDTGSPQDDAPPSEYVYDAEEAEPSLSNAQIAAAIEEGLEVIFSIDPMPMHETYENMRIEGDDDCPYYYDYYLEDYGQYYWRDSCTSENNMSFSGYGMSFFNEDYWSSDTAYYDTYVYVNAASRLVDSDGHTLDISGSSSFYQLSYPESDQIIFYSRILGDFAWDGDDAIGTWLYDGLAVDISFYGVSYEAYDPVGYYSSGSGSLSGMAGDITALSWDGLVTYSDVLGSPCPDEPSGTFSVRDDQGEWYHVEFDGTAYWGAEIFPPECDGCGEVWFRGSSLGQACTDFSRFTSWEVMPW